jgi:zinc transport system permease protein
MTGFFQALFNPAMPFVRNAFFAGVLASILFGILGSIVTVKRIAGLAGAISHAVLGGIGLALFLSVRKIVPGLTPVVGALVFAIIAAALIGIVSLKAKQREDTVINALWAIGMSIGIVFLAMTPGYADPTSYLFGNILLVSTRDLILLATLDIVVMILVWRFYHQIEASAFDEEFARTRGVPTNAIFFVILAVTAVAVVLLQTFVGIVMVIAMLTLPAGTAGYFSRSLAGMMVFAIAFSFLSSVGGLVISWQLNLPSGAVVVLLAGAVFLVISGLKIYGAKRKRKVGVLA